jgi:hypothetical protein
MRRPPLSPGIRPSGSTWRACGPAGAPAVRRTGFGDGQEDTSTDQQHSGIFLLTGRFPWITLAPQESRNNGNRPGPTGSMGSQSSGPSIHSGYLLGCSPSIRAHRHGGATCLPALLAMEVQEKLGPPTRRPPRRAVGQWWSAVWHDVRSLSGHLRIESRLGNELCPEPIDRHQGRGHRMPHIGVPHRQPASSRSLRGTIGIRSS